MTRTFHPAYVRCRCLPTRPQLSSARWLPSSTAGIIDHSEVIVTGSRIAQQGLTGVSPVTSVSADTVADPRRTRVET
jgi:hypothetical protein